MVNLAHGRVFVSAKVIGLSRARRSGLGVLTVLVSDGAAIHASPVEFRIEYPMGTDGRP
jgi:hypothetical protein